MRLPFLSEYAPPEALACAEAPRAPEDPEALLADDLADPDEPADARAGAGVAG